MRRVVTGLIDGRSQVVSDDDLAEFEIVPGLGITARQIWRDDRTPVVPNDGRSPAAGDGPFPPAGGFNVRVMTLPPGQDLGGMHTSETVDVLLVLEGSLTMHLEHGPPTRLAVGDWIVQNGTAHSWTVDDAVPCTIASFVFGADATEQPRN